MEVRIPSSIPGVLVKSDESSCDIDDNFEIYSSSDEDEEGRKKEWEPTPERIIELYNQIANGQLPELHWKCPGRREPSVEGDYEDDIEENPNMEEEDEKPTAFDFDSMFSEPSQPFGKRKNTGTLKVQQKRVARLDKILNDMKKDTSSFQLQSPRVPYQSGNRHDSLSANERLSTLLFSTHTTPAKVENLGIPLPSAYTLTSPCSETLNSSINIPDADDKDMSDSDVQLSSEPTQTEVEEPSPINDAENQSDS